jgi:hypothetical protein
MSGKPREHLSLLDLLDQPMIEVLLSPDQIYMSENFKLFSRLSGRVDKRVSRSVTAMIQGWKLGASHDPRPDRHRSLGADRPIPAA